MAKEEVFAEALTNARWEALSDFYHYVKAICEMERTPEHIEDLFPIRGLCRKQEMAVRAVKAQSKLTKNLADDLASLAKIPEPDAPGAHG
ncbi:MAG TPA: hypothetical protein VF245_12560 [Solirubrobacterales bacterium]